VGGWTTGRAGGWVGDKEEVRERPRQTPSLRVLAGFGCLISLHTGHQWRTGTIKQKANI
jgi:hypothetical protein